MNAQMKKAESRTCAYCGALGADQREHVIPVARLGYRSYDPDRVWLVWSCPECNQLAGSNYFENVPLKAAYVAGRLERKHAKLLNSPEWTWYEISKLSGNLRKAIAGHERERKGVRRRLEHLALVSEQDESYLMPEWMLR